MTLVRWSLVKAVAVLFLLVLPLNAQENPTSPEEAEGGDLVRLFLECRDFGCLNLDHLRNEIQFVNWVMDPKDADVYLLITSQATGAGGSASELVFEGRERFEGKGDTLTYFSPPNSTEFAVRAGLTQQIKIGIMRFVGYTPIAQEIEIGLRTRQEGPSGRPGRQPTVAPEDDPWDFWVFSVRGSGSSSGETTRKTSRLSGSFSANRVTEEWKTSLSFNSSYNETNVEYEEIDYHATTIRRDHRFTGSLVKALAEKWSLGLKGSARNSTYYNFDFSGSLAPVLEYSFFPYSDATRRSLTLQYSIEAVHNNYREETIYFKNSESFWGQSLSAGLNFTQQWGSAYTSVSASHHLEDIDLHNVTFFGGVNLRISRGLSLDLSGSYSRVQDRISVAAVAGATPEEILLQRRQLQTDYTYRTSIGLRYTFGSIFNNIVNPRLGGGFPGGIMIMY